MMTVGLGLLGLLTPFTPYTHIVGFSVLFGLGIGMVFAIVSVTLQNSVAPSQMGVVMSAFAFFQLIGGSLGVAIVGALMNYWNVKYAIQCNGNMVDALDASLDNVFIATVFPGAIVVILSCLIRNGTMIQKAVDDLENRAAAEASSPADSNQPQQAPAESNQPQQAPVGSNQPQQEPSSTPNDGQEAAKIPEREPLPLEANTALRELREREGEQQAANELEVHAEQRPSASPVEFHAREIDL